MNVLFNYSDIEKTKILKNIIRKGSTRTNFKTGVIIKLQKNIYDKLNSLKCIDFIDTKEFINGILEYDFVFYNEKSNICIINKIYNVINELNNKTIFWICIDL